MPRMLRPYEPSGRISPLFGLLAPIALAAVAGLALGYAWVKVETGVGLINGLAAIAALVGGGFATFYAVYLGRVRHRMIAVAFSLLVTAAYLAAVHAGAHQLDPRGASAGVGLMDYLGQRADQGWAISTRRGRTPLFTIRGGWITALWIAEALLTLLVMFGGAIIGASIPYCESCSRHARRERWRFTVKNPTPDSVARIKSAKSIVDLTNVEQLSHAGPSRHEKLDYIVKGCGCSKTAIVCVKSTGLDARGDKTSDDIFTDGLLDPESYERLMRWAESRDPSVAARRPAMQVAAADLGILNSAAGELRHGLTTRTRVSSGSLGMSGGVNAYLDALRDRLSLDGDYDAAETAIAAQRDVNDRVAVVDACADWSSPPKWLEPWARERPDSSALPLVRGVNGVIWAWQARGGDWEPKNYLEFQKRLREADADLERAAEMRPTDAVPWVWMITAAKGLELPREEIARRFKEAVRRDPNIAAAYRGMLSALCAKWGGSHEEMFRFAREASRKAPQGSTIHAMIAEAHLEYAGALGRELNSDDENEYWRGPQVLAEIQTSADKCFGWLADNDVVRRHAALQRSVIDYPASARLVAAALDRCGQKPAGKRLLSLLAALDKTGRAQTSGAPGLHE